ncbi:hypothetical protein BHE74_00043796 [Ensete ventricosum]|uniref:Uncharacterized protein n=1 Tax=Ensete ventricosum TaxID=4639 RepID=A0A426ZQ93_ENSVE|nr:hypothetical protein B296_00036827 [Ensete ventricosum]RWW50006.1 hypothetical protein BHE74_00043796 [Ensete ventricosum]RZR75116.1 hypothetical protein BHM03_00049736 [Ensete ventricosum]
MHRYVGGECFNGSAAAGRIHYSRCMRRAGVIELERLCVIVLLAFLRPSAPATELNGHGVPSNHSFDNQTRPAATAAAKDGGIDRNRLEDHHRSEEDQHPVHSMYNAHVLNGPWPSEIDSNTRPDKVSA